MIIVRSRQVGIISIGNHELQAISLVRSLLSGIYAWADARLVRGTGGGGRGGVK